MKDLFIKIFCSIIFICITVYLIITDRNKTKIIIQTLNNFIVRVHTHIVNIEGSTGKIEYDFVSQKITLNKHGSKPKIFDVVDDNNSRFENQMKYFIQSIKKNSIDENLNLDIGIRFMKLASIISTNKTNLPL